MNPIYPEGTNVTIHLLHCTPVHIELRCVLFRDERLSQPWCSVAHKSGFDRHSRDRFELPLVCYAVPYRRLLSCSRSPCFFPPLSCSWLQLLLMPVVACALLVYDQLLRLHCRCFGSLTSLLSISVRRNPTPSPSRHPSLPYCFGICRSSYFFSRSSTWRIA